MQVKQMSNSDTACMTGVWFLTGAGSFRCTAIGLFVHGWCGKSEKLTDFKMLEAQSLFLLWYSTGTNSLSINLIFIGLCIVIYFYSTTNKMHLLSQIIYSCKTLYMFRMVFPSIIRSSKLHIRTAMVYVKQLLPFDICSWVPSHPQ
jgi:hypothetical protein